MSAGKEGAKGPPRPSRRHPPPDSPDDVPDDMPEEFPVEQSVDFPEPADAEEENEEGPDLM